MKAINSFLLSFITLMLLLSAGCAHKHFSSGTIKTQYQCENGFEFIAETHKDQGPDQVIVKTGGELYVLDITPSASGSKYSDGMHTLWIKGDNAMLEISEDEEYKECSIVKK